MLLASPHMTNLFSELPSAVTPLPVPARVLTIGAHPDDAEFGAGAAIARWADAGAHVTVCVVTDGSKGSWNADEDAPSLIARRSEEQRLAAQELGVQEVIHLGYVDGELEYSKALRRELVRQIRFARPDVVLSHDPWKRYQLHPDHRASGFAAVDAVVDAREPLAHKDLDLPAHRPSSLLLWSPDEADHAEPVEPKWIAIKIRALLCHSSQSTTTMGGAASGQDERQAFEQKLAAWHDASGAAFGIGPAETFKRITP